MMKYEQLEKSQKFDNIILEAKRVLLNEEINCTVNLCSRRNVVFNNEDSYKEISGFEKDVDRKMQSKCLGETDIKRSCDENTPSILELDPCNEKDIVQRTLLQKYFHKWVSMTKTKQDNKEIGIKLNRFIDNVQNALYNNYNSTSLTTQQESKKRNANFENFTNRFKMQKSIINQQKSKIEEQTKIINELKLGIIREDLLKSIENTKIEIREIFSNCSQKLVMNKAPLFKAMEEREKIMVHSQQAPKMIQKMHERALERAQYREIILERKRLIEDARQKLLEEAIEKKRVLEEEERKRNLEIINEQRKKELQMQKIRQDKKREFERKLALAEEFYNHLLVKQCFQKLINNNVKSKENLTLAIAYCSNMQKMRVFKGWKQFIDDKNRKKYQIADGHLKSKVLKRAFNDLKEFKLEATRKMQVAEDMYDVKLTLHTFIHWHRFTCKQIMLQKKKTDISIKHNNRRLLFQYFYMWKSLPVIVQLEKAKEEKKRKWREKVWEIIPDYQPPDPN
ncbi:hypothetical protein ABEB36_008283 [Hypothenemus hampei]|uniref:Uncharacterized protein n=1 Tax=Hypothenemus hampei TaxID=57062 RepID=A0ABD1ELB9_HYPHA